MTAPPIRGLKQEESQSFETVINAAINDRPAHQGIETHPVSDIKDIILTSINDRPAHQGIETIQLTVLDILFYFFTINDRPAHQGIETGIKRQQGSTSLLNYQ